MESPHHGPGFVLGIESSCDETAAAVVRPGRDGAVERGGIAGSRCTPTSAAWSRELASREHLRHIVPVVRAAIAQAGVSFAQLDAIAVTEGPGLAGALLVGILYSKALAFGLGKPLIAINHLEGHIHAVLMQSRHDPALAQYPLLALVVSGGHTHLYLAQPQDGRWNYRNVGRTVDDAAGEAFDKVAKLLGLGYPGGPWMDALAAHGDPSAVRFHFNEIKSRIDEIEPGPRFDFSFSGIKTRRAALRAGARHDRVHRGSPRRAPGRLR